MANVKFSAIAAGTTPAPTDTVIGVQSGTTDAQYTLAQIGASVLKTGNPVVGGTPGSILFIDGSGNLAQDNANFFWDDTNKYLKLGQPGSIGAYYLNGVPAVYEIPNVSGNNWFEGNAGPGPASTMTGNGNFGTGDQALASLTSGSSNFAIGTLALNATTTGSGNTAVGIGALESMISGSHNVALGSNALFKVTANSDNVAAGTNSLSNLTSGDANLAIGTASLSNLATGTGNVGLGVSALAAQTSGNYNTAIGQGALTHLGVGAQNTIIGNSAAWNVSGGNQNTLLGAWEGPIAVGSMSNVIAITDGRSITTDFTKVFGVDYNFTASHVWSFQAQANPIGLHVYNTTDADGAPPTNYERGCLDWNLTSNTFRLASQAGGTGVTRLIAIDGFSKAGAPANTDLPSGTFALIDDTTNNQTWLVFNKGGTIRKVQLT